MEYSPRECCAHSSWTRSPPRKPVDIWPGPSLGHPWGRHLAYARQLGPAGGEGALAGGRALVPGSISCSNDTSAFQPISGASEALIRSGASRWESQGVREHGENPSPGGHQTLCQVQFSCFLTVSLWASQFTSPSFHFPICKMGLQIYTTEACWGECGSSTPGACQRDWGQKGYVLRVLGYRGNHQTSIGQFGQS